MQVTCSTGAQVFSKPAAVVSRHAPVPFRASLPRQSANVASPQPHKAAFGSGLQQLGGAWSIHSRASSHSILAAPSNALEALIFDCDGVIVESEDIHRRAYNAVFEHFNVVCPGEAAPVHWSEEYYDGLQNKVGGGKPKMRYYFGKNGWPQSSVLDGRAPVTDDERTLLIDTLQDWKTDKYKDIIASGGVVARPGVLRLMDEAHAAGVPVAVCSAATKAAVQFVLENLLGRERFAGLDLFMAGDDVGDKKKPDPTIYNVAAERLGLTPEACLVVEDSLIGLQAALGAGMRCIITYTSSTAAQSFEGAESVVASLEDVAFADLQQGALVGRDDRVPAAVSAA